jgi:hypothetical protein
LGVLTKGIKWRKQERIGGGTEREKEELEDGRGKLRRR